MNHDGATARRIVLLERAALDVFELLADELLVVGHKFHSVFRTLVSVELALHSDVRARIKSSKLGRFRRDDCSGIQIV